MKITYSIHTSPFGPCLIGMEGREVCAVSFSSAGSDRAARRHLARAWPDAELLRSDAKTAPVARALFTKGRRRALPVRMQGTSFQKKVWTALVTVPEGKTVTYAEVARAIGSPNAARAVGTACKMNPVAFLVPCHRVLASSGGLGGYNGGLARKRAMLAWEKHTSRK